MHLPPERWEGQGDRTGKRRARKGDSPGAAGFTPSSRRVRGPRRDLSFQDGDPTFSWEAFTAVTPVLTQKQSSLGSS